MTTCLSAIDNTLAGQIGLAFSPSKSEAAQGSHSAMCAGKGSPNKAARPSPVVADNQPSADTPEIQKTDNTPAAIECDQPRQPLRSFSHTLQRRTAIQMHHVPQNSRKAAKPAPARGTALQPSPAQIRLAKPSLNVGRAKEGDVAKPTPEQGYELGQVLANSKANKVLSAPTGTTGPAENKHASPVPKSQMQLKSAYTNTSKKSLAIGAQLDKGKNTDSLQTPSKTLLPAAGPTRHPGTIQLIGRVLVDSGCKTTTTYRKPVIVRSSPRSGGQESSSFRGGKPVPGTIVEADTKAASQANKPPPTQRPALNTPMPSAPSKSPEPQQKITTGPGMLPATAEKRTTRKAADNKMSSESQAAGKGSRPAAHNRPGTSALHRLNAPELQVSVRHTRDGGGFTSDNTSDSAVEPAPLHNNGQPALVQSVSDYSAQSPNTPNAPLRGALMSASEQILDSIHGSLRRGEQQITVRLNPPELGKVFIELKEEQNRIAGVLEVSKIQTRYEIEQQLPQIIRALHDVGIQVRRLEVVLTEEPQQQPCADQSSQDGLFRQHTLAEDSRPGSKSADKWLTEHNADPDIPEPQLFANDGSINVLI